MSVSASLLEQIPDDAIYLFKRTSPSGFGAFGFGVGFDLKDAGRFPLYPAAVGLDLGVLGAGLVPRPLGVRSSLLVF